ncbi:MAG: hypothetical protein WCQ54_07335 [Clostridiaceae bacterium]
MNTNDYLLLLEKMYSKHFTIEKDVKVLDYPINIYARYSDVGGRTFVTQNDIIDKFEVNEFCFIKSFDELNLNDINDFIIFLKSTTEKIVNPNRDHKSTTITGIVVSENSASDEIIKTISKFKFTKAYLFYLHGWSDIRLILIDLQNSSIITNKEGAKVKKVYQNTLLNK